MARLWCLPVAGLLLGLGAAPAAEPAMPAPAFAARVAALVRQLGDEDFDRRQAAQKQLVALGPTVLPVVDTLEPFADPEVENRIGAVRRALGGPVEELRAALTVYATTHPDTARDVGPATRKLIADHQPATGDFLLALIGDTKHPLRRTAVQTFVQVWAAMTAAQIRTYFERSVHFVVTQRPAYPRGVGAMIGLGNDTRNRWAGLPPPEVLKMSTVTVHTLDGKPHGAPYRYPALGCTTGWIQTKDLAVGRHTFSAAVTFEFAHGGQTVAGSVRSPEYTFDMLPADAPDTLAAPANAAVEKLIRAMAFAETTEPPDAPKPLQQNFRPRGNLAAVDWWSPQTTWTGKDGKPNGLHLPCWTKNKILLVDLAFDVSVRIVATGEEYPADPLVSFKGAADTAPWQFYVRDAEALAKGRSGFVPVRIVLKPSRSVALTYPRVTKYFTGEIVSEPLRMKVGPAAAKPEADPFGLLPK